MTIRGFVGRLLIFSVRAVFTLGGAAAVLLVILLGIEGVSHFFPAAPEPLVPARLYTAYTLDQNPGAASQDATLYLSTRPLQSYAALYDGLRLNATWPPFSWIRLGVKLENPNLHGEIGLLDGNATIVIQTDRPSIGWLALGADLTMSFYEIDVSHHTDPKDDNCDLVFVPHIERIRAAGPIGNFFEARLPNVSSYIEHIAGRLLDQAINKKKDDGSYTVEVKLAVPRRVVLPLKIDQKDDLPFTAIKWRSDENPSTIGTLHLETILPETSIIRYFDYAYPIITPDGLWLFATVQEQQPSWITEDRLQSALSKLDRSHLDGLERGLANAVNKLNLTAPKSADLELRLRTDPLLQIADQINKLDALHRTATIHTLSSEGNVAALQTDTSLGTLGLSADIPNKDAVHGAIALLNISAMKGPGGIQIVGSATAHAETSLRLNFSQLAIKQNVITADVVGDSAPTTITSQLSTFERTTNVQGVSYSAAYWGLDSACAAVVATLKSDSGKLGGAFPVKYDAVNVILNENLFKDKARPSLIVSSLPTRNALINSRPPDADKANPAADTWMQRVLARYKKPFFELAPPSKGVEIAIAPTTAMGSANDYLLTANLTLRPAPESDFNDQEKMTRQAALDALKDLRFPGDQQCAQSKPIQIIINGLELGPDGDVIKYLSALVANEQAKLKLLVDIFQGKDTAQDLKNVAQTELTKYKIAFDQAGKVIQSSFDQATKILNEGGKVFDGTLKTVQELAANPGKAAGDAVKKGQDAVDKGKNEVEKRTGIHIP